MADRRGSTSRPTFVVGGGSNSPSRDVSDDDSPAEEPAGTPGIEELRRTLSFKRLQSLGPNEIRQSVWRPPNAPKKRPRDVDQLVGHSIRTAIRAALLAYSARTTFVRLDGCEDEADVCRTSSSSCSRPCARVGCRRAPSSAPSTRPRPRTLARCWAPSVYSVRSGLVEHAVLSNCGLTACADFQS